MSDKELDKQIEKILLHDDDCQIPDPQGCSCGALLTRIIIKRIIKSRDQQIALAARIDEANKSAILIDEVGHYGDGDYLYQQQVRARQLTDKAILNQSQENQDV